MSPSEPNSEPHALRLSDAAELVGTTVEALRLRVKRGTLKAVPVVGARGRTVAGVLRSELLEAFQGANPTANSEPHGQPGAEPHAEPHGIAGELERERALRQAQAETNSRALAVLQDRQLGPIVEHFRQEARIARRDSRILGAGSLVLVAALGSFAVYRIEQATRATVQAQERTIEAMGETQAAQAKALQESTSRAALESELTSTRSQARDSLAQANAALAAESKARNQAESRLFAIDLLRRAKAAFWALIHRLR